MTLVEVGGPCRRLEGLTRDVSELRKDGVNTCRLVLQSTRMVAAVIVGAWLGIVLVQTMHDLELDMMEHIVVVDDLLAMLPWSPRRQSQVRPPCATNQQLVITMKDRGGWDKDRHVKVAIVACARRLAICSRQQPWNRCEGQCARARAQQLPLRSKDRKNCPGREASGPLALGPPGPEAFHLLASRPWWEELDYPPILWIVGGGR